MADQMALNKVLKKDLNDFLYPKNDFINGNAMFDSQGSSVHRVEINESQEQPNISENATAFPLPVHSTEDANKSYDIDTLRSEPTYIEDVDELLTVFNKRANELKKHAKAMQTQYYDKVANLWALEHDATAIVETTGAAAAVINGDMTGTRKQLAREDWVKAVSTLAKQDVPTDGLKALVDTAMYWNLYELDEFILYTNTGVTDPMITGGAIGELLGVKIYVRNNLGFSYTKTLSAKNGYLNTDGSRRVYAADDNMAIMMWHPAFVRYSFGNEKIYSEIDSPTLQGSVFSTRMRCGAMRSRIDNKGVCMIVQDWVS